MGAAVCQLGNLNKDLFSGHWSDALGDVTHGKPPSIPKIPKPPVLDPGAVAKKQAEAALVAQLKAAGAYGSSDTNLTGGLGAVPKQNLNTYLGQA